MEFNALSEVGQLISALFWAVVPERTFQIIDPLKIEY
jgi:hypothetical protein